VKTKAVLPRNTLQSVVSAAVVEMFVNPSSVRHSLVMCQNGDIYR